MLRASATVTRAFTLAYVFGTNMRRHFFYAFVTFHAIMPGVGMHVVFYYAP